MNSFWLEVSTSAPYIFLAWATLTLIALSPGPSVMAIMGISLSKGRAAGFLFTAGCMTGATLWATLAGLGLSVWLMSFANGVFVLKLFGGMYLGWMAYKSMRSAMLRDRPTPRVSVSEHQGGKVFLQGLALHVTNPKSVLGWASVIAISQSGNGSTLVLIVTLVLCLLTTFAIHFTYAGIFASKRAMQVYAKIRRPIDGMLAAVFGYGSYRLIFS